MRFYTCSGAWASALAAAAGLVFAVLAASTVSAQVEGRGGEEPEAAATGEVPTARSISGVFPRMAALAEHAPRSEAGIGALMPWADRLWLITYVSHKAPTGAGTGLYSIGESMRLRKHPESVVGTYANRMIHAPTDQLMIGPHLVDTTGGVRTIEGLVDHRLAATARHLERPEEMVYVLTMEGLFLEVELASAAVDTLYDLTEELELPETATPHFKSAATGFGRVVVTNNTYHEAEHREHRRGGRLAEYDGTEWRILSRDPHVGVAAYDGIGGAIYATGWDRASAQLRVFHGGSWSTYRLPKGSHSWDHAWTTEWMRIREVETERLLLDLHGQFYELPRLIYDDRVWGIQPVGRHLRVVPDFVSWRGMLVLAGNQTAVAGGNDRLGGQPQSGLWFGTTDDLWDLGEAAGWGGPWRQHRLDSAATSDPYLMTGFDEKVLHLWHEADEPVTFTVEVDPLGSGIWRRYERITVDPGEYVHHGFPDAFSAHWVRLRTDRGGVVTAQFVYH